MGKCYQTSLFLFHRDLRLDDNTGLLAALEASNNVIPCFIFDPRQVEAQNEYRSLNALQFLLESLYDLNQQLADKGSQLLMLYGRPEVVLERLLATISFQALYSNRDYTPFSRTRDKALTDLCIQRGLDVHSFDDLLLANPEDIRSAQGTPYVKFTAFYNHARVKPVVKPRPNIFINYVAISSTKTIFPDQVKDLDQLAARLVPSINQQIGERGGRAHALKRLRSLNELKDYEQTHDFPAYQTTQLSAHNKFGTVSIREVYHALLGLYPGGPVIIRQLYWRDFFTYIAWHFPHVFGHAFRARYTTLVWDNNPDFFERWSEGLTGFPFVDAGMRQLNRTGFIHNRARLVTASFLVKDLHIDWRWGEKYYAQHLVDYDPSVNNGNWQWVASTGCDVQPYFRIFNPWLQQKKFDPTCEYIKQWVPELRELEPRVIHTWYAEKKGLVDYPVPIVDHARESIRSKQLYRAIQARNL